MTLPAYPNAISLQQIQAEFGGPSSNIALENYYAGGANVPSGTTSPTSGAVPSSGAISLENFWGTSKGYNNWYYTYQGFSVYGSYFNYFSGTGSDSSGNIYGAGSFAGETFGSPWRAGFVAQFAAKGALNWMRTIGPSGAPAFIEGSATSSAGNTYAVVVYSTTVYLVKYNSSGTLQWQVQISSAAANATNTIAVSAAENVYLTLCSGSGYSVVNTLKFNSSGTLQWQRQIGGDSNVVGARTCMGIDSSENVYLLWQASASGTGGAYYQASYNSSGTIQAINYYYFGSGTLLQSGDPLPMMYIGSSGSQYYFCLPFYLTGSFNVSYVVGGPGFTSYCITNNSYPTLSQLNGMTVDASGNMYIVANSELYGTSYLKITSSGSLTQYAANFAGAAGADLYTGGPSIVGSNLLLQTQTTATGTLILTETNGTNYSTATEWGSTTNYPFSTGTPIATDSAGSLSVSSTSALTSTSVTPYSSSLNGLT